MRGRALDGQRRFCAGCNGLCAAFLEAQHAEVVRHARPLCVFPVDVVKVADRPLHVDELDLVAVLQHIAVVCQILQIAGRHAIEHPAIDEHAPDAVAFGVDALAALGAACLFQKRRQRCAGRQLIVPDLHPVLLWVFDAALPGYANGDRPYR